MTRRAHRLRPKTVSDESAKLQSGAVVSPLMPMKRLADQQITVSPIKRRPPVSPGHETSPVTVRLLTMNEYQSSTATTSPEKISETSTPTKRRKDAESPPQLTMLDLELKKINDLRQSGENQQFLDDTVYLMDGLKGESVGLRRSCFVDLLQRCADKETGTDFLTKFKALGFIDELLDESLVYPEDALSSLCFLLICCAILHYDDSAAKIMASKKFLIDVLLNFIHGKLDNHDDSLKKRKDKELLREIMDHGQRILTEGHKFNSSSLKESLKIVCLNLLLDILVRTKDCFMDHEMLTIFGENLDTILEETADDLSQRTLILKVCERLSVLNQQVPFMQTNFGKNVNKVLDCFDREPEFAQDLLRIMINVSQKTDSTTRLFLNHDQESILAVFNRLLEANIVMADGCDFRQDDLTTLKLLTCFIINLLDQPSEYNMDFFSSASVFTPRLLSVHRQLVQCPERRILEELLLLSYYYSYLTSMFVYRTDYQNKSDIRLLTKDLDEFSHLLESVMDLSTTPTNDQYMLHQFQQMSSQLQSMLNST